MNVGVCRVSFRLAENLDLKGKRQVVKSIIGRVRSKFNVTISEVEDNDEWQIATLGIGYISNDRRHTNQVLSQIINHISSIRIEAEMLDYEIEIISM